MSKNFNEKDHAELNNGMELKDELLEKIAAGGNGDSYRFDREENRFCPWCGNTGPWAVYVNVNDPNDEEAMCKTCGNAGFRP